MILNQSEYNPLKDILDLLPSEPVPLTNEILDSINKLLFNAGVVTGSKKELGICIDILAKLGLFEITYSSPNNFFIKRGM